VKGLKPGPQLRIARRKSGQISPLPVCKTPAPETKSWKLVLLPLAGSDDFLVRFIEDDALSQAANARPKRAAITVGAALRRRRVPEQLLFSGR
jgi:hypothetical protein